jgi:cation diffusion facilitator CzcD-associated flavoprotein CzcO
MWRKGWPVAKKDFDVVIVGSGPAALGAAFHIAENSAKSVLILDKNMTSTGGLRNDCKQNYTFPVGFPKALWSAGRTVRYFPAWRTPG